MTEATPSPSQVTESVVFYKYKNVAFGHCHLDLNSLNHNFLGFRYKRSCNMVQQATLRESYPERQKALLGIIDSGMGN